MTQKIWTGTKHFGTCKRTRHYLLISSPFFHGILDNVKALYRRARAHVGAWNPEQAKNDFKKVAELDSGLEVTCRKELRRVEEMEKDKDKDDQEKMRNLF